MIEKETDIQLAICDYLCVKRYFFWRQNTSPIWNSRTGSYKTMPKYSMTGLPDIIVIKRGIFIGLEVKIKKGRQTPSQKDFERRVKEAGAEYYVVTSIDDVMEAGL